MDKKDSLRAEAEELIAGFKTIFFKRIGCEAQVMYTLEQDTPKFKLPLYIAAVDELIVNDPFVKRKQSIKQPVVDKHVRFYKQAYVTVAAEQGYLYRDIVESIGKDYNSYVNASIRVVHDAMRCRDLESQTIARIYSKVRETIKALKDADI